MDQEEMEKLTDSIPLAMNQNLSQPMVQTFTDEQYMHGLNNKLDNLIKIQETAKANAKAEKAALEARLKTVEKQIRELQNNKAGGQRLAKVRGDVLNQTHRLGKGSIKNKL